MSTVDIRGPQLYRHFRGEGLGLRGALDPSQLPREVAVSTITMAELGAGPDATSDPDQRGRRQDRLQRAEAAFDPLPLDVEAARAHGRIFANVVAKGRGARGARAVD